MRNITLAFTDVAAGAIPDAKRASTTRWTSAAVAVALFAGQGAAEAQSTSEIESYRLKAVRITDAGPSEPLFRGLVMPSEQTRTRPYFGYRLILGGRYEPLTKPRDAWIWVGCLSQDPRVAYDEEKFGFSLVRVHALIYELNRDGSLNHDTVISTVDTTESDEAICDLEYGVDTSFIEIPRSFKAAVVSLFSVGRSTQYIEVVENVERALAR